MLIGDSCIFFGERALIRLLSSFWNWQSFYCWVLRILFIFRYQFLPWRRERLPTLVFCPREFQGLAKSRTQLKDFHFTSPVFLSGKPHGQRSLATVHEITRVRHDLATKPPPPPPVLYQMYGLQIFLPDCHFTQLMESLEAQNLLILMKSIFVYLSVSCVFFCVVSNTLFPNPRSWTFMHIFYEFYNFSPYIYVWSIS